MSWRPQNAVCAVAQLHELFNTLFALCFDHALDTHWTASRFHYIANTELGNVNFASIHKLDLPARKVWRRRS